MKIMSTNQKKGSIIQILDDYDIDGKSLCCYVKGNSEMNLTLHLITCVVSIDPVWKILHQKPTFCMKNLNQMLTPP